MLKKENEKIYYVALAMFLSLITMRRAEAMNCVFTPTGDGHYSLAVKGSTEETTFSASSCSGQLPSGITNWNDMKIKLHEVEFDSNITSIASNTFFGANNLRSASMPNVKTIGGSAFRELPYLSEVYMPNVEYIGDAAFYHNTSLTSVDMPKVETIYGNAFSGDYNLSYISAPSSATAGWCAFAGTVVIGGNCHGFGFGECKDKDGKKICGSCNDYIKVGTGCVKNCGKGWLGKEGKCIDSALGCGAGYKDMGGFCNRVRYTPAEAAAVANDDNTNVVTITFRK